jgi:hypothetical protein
LPDPAIVVHSSDELKNRLLPADLYLDAILGTGFKPPVRGLYADAITIMNASQIPVIAVDIPSGADADGMSPQTGTIDRADAMTPPHKLQKRHPPVSKTWFVKLCERTRRFRVLCTVWKRSGGVCHKRRHCLIQLPASAGWATFGRSLCKRGTPQAIAVSRQCKCCPTPAS